MTRYAYLALALALLASPALAGHHNNNAKSSNAPSVATSAPTKTHPPGWPGGQLDDFTRGFGTGVGGHAPDPSAVRGHDNYGNGGGFGSTHK